MTQILHASGPGSDPWPWARTGPLAIIPWAGTGPLALGRDKTLGRYNFSLYSLYPASRGGLQGHMCVFLILLSIVVVGCDEPSIPTTHSSIHMCPDMYVKDIYAWTLMSRHMFLGTWYLWTRCPWVSVDQVSMDQVSMGIYGPGICGYLWTRYLWTRYLWTRYQGI